MKTIIISDFIAVKIWNLRFFNSMCYLINFNAKLYTDLQTCKTE
jgi:hypothetical protein